MVFCYALAPWAGVSGSHCNAIVERQFRAGAMPVVINGVFDEETMCTFLLELCGMDEWRAIEVQDWVQDMVSTKPAVAKSNNYVNNLYDKLDPDTNLIKVVLFSDLHVQADYVIGMSNTCNDQICCRAESG